MMRWKHNTKLEQEFIKPMRPNIGDTRIVIKFALFPKIIKDRWVWLEQYHSIQEYKNTIGYYEEMVHEGIIFNTVKTLRYKYNDWIEVKREFKEWLN